jgi:hypothetical protein
MASARFQLFVVARVVAAPDLSITADMQSRLGVTWRLLSTNNRDLGHSAVVFPDVKSCAVALGHLRERLAGAAVLMSPVGRASWTWKMVIDGTSVAVSSRAYSRRVHCEHAYAVFFGSVAEAVVTETQRIVYT